MWCAMSHNYHYEWGEFSKHTAQKQYLSISFTSKVDNSSCKASQCPFPWCIPIMHDCSQCCNIYVAFIGIFCCFCFQQKYHETHYWKYVHIKVKINKKEKKGNRWVSKNEKDILVTMKTIYSNIQVLHI